MHADSLCFFGHYETNSERNIIFLVNELLTFRYMRDYGDRSITHYKIHTRKIPV